MPEVDMLSLSVCAAGDNKKRPKSNPGPHITETTLDQIRKLRVFEHYNKTKDQCGVVWTWLPKKICNPCHGSLSKAWTNEKKRL